jgi:hypothetical protein
MSTIVDDGWLGLVNDSIGRKEEKLVLGSFEGTTNGFERIPPPRTLSHLPLLSEEEDKELCTINGCKEQEPPKQPPKPLERAKKLSQMVGNEIKPQSKINAYFAIFIS